jgi:OOP family OmpA-OmpF porin
MVLALVVVMLSATGSALAGGGEKGDWEIGPYAGYGWLDSYDFLHPKDDTLYGVRGGYFFSPSFSLELSLQRLSTRTDIGTIVGVQNQDVDLDACRLNMLYNFAPGSHFRPFLTAGVGCEQFDAHDLGQTAGLGLNAGLGLRMLMGDHFGIRLDGRYVSADVGGRVNDRQRNVEGTLGLTFLFGGGPPPDLDADGVPDGKDDCPDTPRGATVDARGCPKDSDGDGVYDGIDQCPDTPRGAKVDAKGCPLDSDGDGVYDGLDRCPDTPRGEKVDSVGCTIATKTPSPMIQTLLEKKAVVLEGVEFDSDKDTLRPESRTILDDVAASLMEWPDIRVEIQGHTDSTASAAHNLDLSNRRAQSVSAYLVSKGISASRLEAKGYGEDHPIADNKTKEGKQKNRRVELHKID